MHTRTTLLLLSFLLATLLSLTVAYPHPKSLDLRGFSAATASTSSSSPSRTNTQSSRTKTNKANKQQQQQQKKKEREHDGPENHSLESHRTEAKESGADGGDGNGTDPDPDDGGGKKCPAPLPQRYAAQFENGHGCKKIAEAFANCKVSDQWYCQKLSTQKGCLCGRNQSIYSDELVELCYDYMVAENLQQAALNVGRYRGLCLR